MIKKDKKSILVNVTIEEYNLIKEASLYNYRSVSNYCKAVILNNVIIENKEKLL